MSYKPDEQSLMAYLYGELEGEELRKFENYLASSPEARAELQRLKELRAMMGALEDKEVIAPPIVIDRDRRIRFSRSAIWTMAGVAASLLLLITVGYLTKATLSITDSEFRIAFGESKQVRVMEPVAEVEQQLTQEQVQQMINASMMETRANMEASLHNTEEKLDASIRTNLALNSNRIDQLMKTASNASQDQIQSYVATMQAENLKMVKDYFQLTSTEQRQYIEDLLVDFSKYLQQQRQNDLLVVQSRLNNIENNTDLFRQETEQILASLLSTTNEPTIKN